MPPDSFLNANFVADEIEPQFVFGKVKDFWKSRSCTTNWLIEDSERDRLKNLINSPVPSSTPSIWKKIAPGKL